MAGSLCLAATFSTCTGLTSGRFNLGDPQTAVVDADRLLRLSCPVTIRFSTVVAEFRDSRMAFNELTQRIVNQVEEVSGRPVIVQADSTVRVAALMLARGSAPAHVVKYNPALGAEADYAICFQCGYALRIFSAPEAERFDVLTSTRGHQEGEAICVQHFQKVGVAMPATNRSQILRQFVRRPHRSASVDAHCPSGR